MSVWVRNIISLDSSLYSASQAIDELKILFVQDYSNPKCETWVHCGPFFQQLCFHSALAGRASQMSHSVMWSVSFSR